MQRIQISILVLLILASGLFAGGCARKQQDENEIPITTASSEALDYFMQGRDALEMGKIDNARDLFDEAIASDPGFACAYDYRSRCMTSAADWKEQIDQAVSHKASASEGEQIMIDIQMTYLTGDAAGRYELAKKLVNTYAKSQRALLILAGEQSGMKEYTLSRSTLKKAINIDTKFAPPYRDLALSFLFDEPKDFDEAKRYMVTFADLKPDEPTAHIGMGDVFRAQLRLEDARDAYAKAVELDPSSTTAISKKGHAETFMGNYEAARADFDKAIKLSQGAEKAGAANFKTFTWLYAGDVAEALKANGDMIAAFDDFGMSESELHDPMMQAYSNRFEIAVQAGDFEAAREALIHSREWGEKTADDLDSEEFRNYMHSGIALQRGLLAAYEGAFDLAREKAEEAAALLVGVNNPRKMEAYHKLLGRVCLMEANLEGALKHFESADADAVDVKYYKALALEATGNEADSKALFREVADWNFNWIEYALIRSAAIAKLR